MIAAALLASVPVLYWPEPAHTAPRLRAAGVVRLCAPPATVPSWRAAGFEATGCERAGRVVLDSIGLAGRPDVAAPTQRPWIDANGWRFQRRPADRYWYQAPAGKAALAAAEASAYGVDAVLAVAAEDLAEAGRALSFLAALPEADLPAVSDVTVVDDGSDETAEVLNLLARRNILFDVAAKAPASTGRLVVRPGSGRFSRATDGDPDAFALEVRRAIGDENRSLRIFGTEVVLARVAGDARRRRVHLLSYAGRPIEGVRLRLRGRWAEPTGRALGSDAAFEDFAQAADSTEVSIASLGAYAVLDFAAAP